MIKQASQGCLCVKFCILRERNQDLFKKISKRGDKTKIGKNLKREKRRKHCTLMKGKKK